MSDYHILAADSEGNGFTIVCHVPVPDVNNEVAVSYRTALVQWRGGADAIDSQVPFITQPELDQLKAGELYEATDYFYSHPGESLVQKRNRIDVIFNQTVTDIQARLQNNLSFWGYSRNV